MCSRIQFIATIAFVPVVFNVVLAKREAPTRRGALDLRLVLNSTVVIEKDGHRQYGDRNKRKKIISNQFITPRRTNK